MSFNSIMIYGLGLIGGSFAMALSSLEKTCPNSRPYIIGVDPEPSARSLALDGGFVQEVFSPDDPKIDSILALSKVDLVVLAMPPSLAPDVFKCIASNKYRGLITDTSSTKTLICAAAEEILDDSSLFLPGHPMAGSEASGFSAASAGLFAGKYWILCPDERTDGEIFTAMHSLVTSIGARCISVDRNDHDQMVASISHVPHITASVLVDLVSSRSDEAGELFRLASGGFRDSTRIAAGSPALWTDILMGNATEVAQGARELADSLIKVAEYLDCKDQEGLKAFLTRTSDIRKSIPAAWIPNSDRLVGLRISMTDGIGVVAGVTSAAGRFGCNIQSIDIEHITDDSAILDLLLTDEGSIEAFVDELKKLGYTVVEGPLEIHP